MRWVVRALGGSHSRVITDSLRSHSPASSAICVSMVLVHSRTLLLTLSPSHLLTQLNHAPIHSTSTHTHPHIRIHILTNTHPQTHAHTHDCVTTLLLSCANLCALIRVNRITPTRISLSPTFNRIPRWPRATSRAVRLRLAVKKPRSSQSMM